MIALDTNVLVRYFVEDDPVQTPAAQELINGLTPQNPGFISREVAVEVVWVLDRTYGFSSAQIEETLMRLIATDSLAVEVSQDIARAAAGYARGEADFADLMILAAAKRAGAKPLYTFDRKLARSADAALVQV